MTLMEMVTKYGIVYPDCPNQQDEIDYFMADMIQAGLEYENLLPVYTWYHHITCGKKPTPGEAEDGLNEMIHIYASELDFFNDQEMMA